MKTPVVATAVAWFLACQPFASTVHGASPQGKGADPIQTDINISGRFLQNPEGKDPHDPDNIQRCGSPRLVKNVLQPEARDLAVVCFGVGGFNFQTPQPRTDWSTTDVTKGPSRAVAPVFVSNDGGNTWRRVLPDPLTGDYFQSDRDPMAAYGPKGEMYISADAEHFPVERKYGPVVVTPGLFPKEVVGLGFSRSVDGGRTWSKASLIPLPPSSPQIAVDQTTGVIYATSICVYVTKNRIGPFGCRAGQRMLAVSTDQGRTWSPSPEIFSKEPATTTRTAGRLHDVSGLAPSYLTAAHGVFATIGRSEADGNQRALRYSTDNGATFAENPMKLGANCSPQKIVADPTHRGGFAVLAGCSQPSEHKEWWLSRLPSLRVYVTRDMGVTWKEGPELAAPPPPGYVVHPSKAQESPTDEPLSSLVSLMPMSFFINKTEIAYSPTGVLGVAWTQIYGPAFRASPGTNLPMYPPAVREDPLGPSDFFLALSSDGGTTFGKPVRLNTAASPPSDPRQHDGDERWMGLVLDRRFAYAAWGDWRSGEVQTWFRKVPLPGGS